MAESPGPTRVAPQLESCSPAKPWWSTPAARPVAHSHLSAASRATRCTSCPRTCSPRRSYRPCECWGAEVELIHSDDGIHPGLVPQMQAREREGAFATDQFNNLDSLDGYREIGKELVQQIEGEIHGVVAYVGIGGAYTGASQPIRNRWPHVIRTVVEPAESAVIAGGSAGSHMIEGGGVGFGPPLISPESYDRLDAVSTQDAFAAARELARSEGVDRPEWRGQHPGRGAARTGARPRPSGRDAAARFRPEVPFRCVRRDRCEAESQTVMLGEVSSRWSSFPSDALSLIGAH